MTTYVTAPRLQDTSRLLIRPGQTARVVMTAHCADKTLPAFVNNHLISLRPAAQFLANDRWGNMQMSLLRYFAANPGLVRPHDQQLMLWGLQGKEANGSPFYFQALMRRNDLLQVLEQAHPGGLAEIQRAQAMDEINRHIQQIVRQSMPTEVRQLLGDASIIPILADPQQAPRLIEQELERAARMQPTRGPSAPVGPEAAFSTLAPNVHAHAIGSGRLTATATITNMGHEPFVFVPSEYVAETQTEHQRGLFTGFSRAQVFDHPVAQGWEQADTAASLASLSGRIVSKNLGGRGMRPGNPVFDRFSRATRQLHRSQFSALINNPAARTVVPYVPLLGNAKSAFDLFDPNLSTPERLLAAIGVIPGAGNIAKLAVGGGRAIPQVARWAMDNGGARSLATLSQRTEVLRELNDLRDLVIPDGGVFWQASAEQIANILPSQFRA